MFGINISSILFFRNWYANFGLITNAQYSTGRLSDGTGAVHRRDIHKSGFINYHDPGWAQHLFENGFLSSHVSHYLFNLRQKNI